MTRSLNDNLDGGGKFVDCSQCGTKVWRSAYFIKHRKDAFCDRGCYLKNIHDKRIISTCETCGNKYYSSPYAMKKATHHFCSKGCAGIAITREVVVACDWCGLRTARKLSEIQGKIHRYCSRNCKEEYENKYGRVSPGKIEASDTQKKKIQELLLLSKECAVCKKTFTYGSLITSGYHKSIKSVGYKKRFLSDMVKFCSKECMYKSRGYKQPVV